MNGSMTNYEVPAASEVPNDHDRPPATTWSTTNEMGFKGVGETGTIASPPAVINAVIDALSHLGVTDVPRPASPENVWRTIQQAQREVGSDPGTVRVRTGRLRRRGDRAARFGEDAKVIAGGHSLLPLMRLRFARPALLVDIDRLVGPGVRPGRRRPRRDRRAHAHGDVGERRAAAAPSRPLMAYTAGLVGDPQVRHRGTIGGSVAHGDPASDLPTDAARARRDVRRRRARAASGRSRRADFFKGIFETDLDAARRPHRDPRAEDRRGRLVVPEVPPARDRLGDRGRRGAGAATTARTQRGGRADEHGLEAPIRATAVERRSAGRRATRSAASAARGRGNQPVRDTNASAEYRRALAGCSSRALWRRRSSR